MTQLELPITWKVEIDSKELRAYILAKERLKPWALDIGERYSEYLEYGTGPAMNSSDGMLEMAIRIWVKRKAGPDLSPKEQENMIQRVLWSIRKHGLKERPFFRPAFYYMAEHIQEWFDKGYSFEEMITMMENKVVDLIHYNINAPSEKQRIMSDTGRLEMSVSIRSLKPDEVDSALAPAIRPRSISDDIWEDRAKQQGRSWK